MGRRGCQCPAFWVGLPLKRMVPMPAIDRRGVCCGVDTQIDPPISSLPSPRDGRLADTYPRQPDSLAHHVNPIRWIGHLNDRRRDLPTHRVGLATYVERRSRLILVVHIYTIIQPLFNFGRDRLTRTWDINSPPDGTFILPRVSLTPPPSPPSISPWVSAWWAALSPEVKSLSTWLTSR